MKSGLFRLWFQHLPPALLAVIASACSQPVPASTLPPPMVSTVQTGGSEITSAPPTTASPLITGTAPPPASPAELAEQLYGERLIRSITIPAINLTSAVIPVGWQVDPASADGTEWDSPGSLVGWVLTSALPDEPGNIILYGHNNVYGSVFKDLYMLKQGDLIQVETSLGTTEFRVLKVELLPIFGASAEEQAARGNYLLPTSQSRLTIISCYPPETNTHRVVVIAR